jgi:predicted RNA-binding protein with PUA-like domain
VTYFLAKTEPTVYSIGDLERDKTTTWDGIKNPQALQTVRSMAPGDRVFIYHSGGEPQIAGLAEVKSAPKPDPKNPKLTVVDFGYLLTFVPPVTLAEIKSSKQFDSWALVRQGRLSTMAAPDLFVSWMRKRYPNLKI